MRLIYNIILQLPIPLKNHSGKISIWILAKYYVYLPKVRFSTKKLINLRIMRGLAIILFALLLCLPNTSSAQDRQQRKAEQRALQGALATIWYSGIYNGVYEFEWGDRNIPVPWAFARQKRKGLPPTRKATNPDTGMVIAMWKDGCIYNGQMYFGEIQGAGIMHYADGSIYSGMWKNDMPHGKGTYITPNGVKFSVKSYNGLPHGKGVIQDSDGTMYRAKWDRAMLKPKSIKPLKKK